MKHIPALSLWFGAICLLGCREDIAAPRGVDVPFAVYGVISPQLDTQSVKVFPVTDIPVLLPPEPLDAVVTSTDLTTGEVRTWTDSVITNVRGQYQHVFWSDFTAEHEHRYRIEVLRPSDGATSTAEASIPPLAAVEVEEPEKALLRITIRGAGFRVLETDVRYVWASPPVDDAVSYRGMERRTETGWQIDVSMKRDHNILHERYFPGALAFCGRKVLDEMWLTLIVGDPAWDPPGGIIDMDEVSHPRVMMNVQNGYGFVGGGYRITERLRPSGASLAAACYGTFNPSKSSEDD